ncbi:MAG: MarR family transcriptional regulator, partial [Streptomyces sp.]|nr:MarR family transcriptional regulator [Streptomyces sp.]
PGHAAFADRLAEAFGESELAEAVGVLERLSKVLGQISTGDGRT